MLKYTTKFLTALALVWGSAAFASLTPANDAGQDLQTISAWTTHLNFYYPQLDVMAFADMTSNQGRQAVLNDLQKLEDYLHGDIQLNNATLTHLACTNPVCGEN